VTAALPLLRHLDYGDAATVEDVGPAGLQAILDGYDVADWQPILVAVQRHPWGVVARRVEQVVEHLESYGTRAALEGWLRRCRAGVDAPAYSLAQLRRAAGLSQRELAARLDVSQAQVARLEAAAMPTARSTVRFLAALDCYPVATLAVGPDGAVVIPTRG